MKRVSARLGRRLVGVAGLTAIALMAAAPLANASDQLPTLSVTSSDNVQRIELSTGVVIHETANQVQNAELIAPVGSDGFTFSGDRRTIGPSTEITNSVRTVSPSA